MSVSNPKVQKTKNQLVRFITYCHNEDMVIDHKRLVETFLFDNITYLSDIEKNDFDLQKFKKHDPYSNKQLEKLISDSLEYFIESFEKTRKAQPSKAKDSSLNKKQDITEGLLMSGNNDGDFNNVPSALALSTFRI